MRQRLQDRQDICVAFALGFVDHWVGLFANKLGDDIELLLMDSLNSCVIEATDEGLWQVSGIMGNAAA